MQSISGSGGMATICWWYLQGLSFYYSSGHWKDLITKLRRGISKDLIYLIYLVFTERHQKYLSPQTVNDI